MDELQMHYAKVKKTQKVRDCMISFIRHSAKRKTISQRSSLQAGAKGGADASDVALISWSLIVPTLQFLLPTHLESCPLQAARVTFPNAYLSLEH